MTTLTIRELKRVASNLKIKRYSNLKKADLVVAINAHLDAKAQVQHGECCPFEVNLFPFDREELQDMVLENAIPLEAPPVVEPVKSHPLAIYAIAFLIVLLETIGTYTARKAIQLLTWVVGWYSRQSFNSMNACWQKWRQTNMAIA